MLVEYVLKVLEEELVLAVPASFPALKAKKIPGRKYPAIKAGALKGQKLVMLTNGQYMQSQLKAITFEQGIELSAAAVVKSLEAQIEFVKAGIGMALTPSGIDRFCKPGEVTFYSFEEDFPRREAVIIWRKDRKLSKTAQELKNVILSIDW